MFAHLSLKYIAFRADQHVHTEYGDQRYVFSGKPLCWRSELYFNWAIFHRHARFAHEIAILAKVLPAERGSYRQVGRASLLIKGSMSAGPHGEDVGVILSSLPLGDWNMMGVLTVLRMHQGNLVALINRPSGLLLNWIDASSQGVPAHDISLQTKLALPDVRPSELLKVPRFPGTVENL